MGVYLGAGQRLSQREEGVKVRASGGSVGGGAVGRAKLEVSEEGGVARVLG